MERPVVESSDARPSSVTPPSPPMPLSPSGAGRIQVILDPNAAVVTTQAAAQQLDAIDGKLDGTYLGKPIVVADHVEVAQPLVTTCAGVSATTIAVSNQIHPITVAAVCDDAQTPAVAIGQPMCLSEPVSTCRIQCCKHHRVSSDGDVQPQGTEMLESVGRTPAMRAIDPQVGAYYIPLTHLVETAGSRSGLSGERDPSICLLYQGGSCKAQEHCRQIHAEAGFITRMRELHRVNNDCCVKHGDVWSHTSEFNTLLAKYQGAFVISARSARGQMLYVPKAYVAHTAPMVTSLRLLWDSQDPIYIPLHQLCGLHQKRKCLYGQDCKSIHICRDLWGSFLQNHTWLQQAVKNQRHLTGAGSGPGRGRGKGKGWLRNRSVKLKADPDEASPSSGSVEKAEKTVRLKEELDEDRPEKLQPTPKPSRARRLSLRFRSEPEVKEIS